MARAKRTDRAEARRRYRAQLAEHAGEPTDESVDDADAAQAPSRPATPFGRSRQPTAAPGQTQPSGIGYAFRAAFHQPKYREDIAYLPRLVLHPAVWGPVLVTIGTAVVFLATGGRELFSTLLIQYFVAPPPIGAIFIAGFFAPRASYLAGLIVGVVSAIVLAATIAFAPPSLASSAPGSAASPSPGTSTVASPASSAASSSAPSAAATPPTSASPTASASPVGSASPSASPAGSPAPSQAPGGVIPSSMNAEQALTYALATSPLSGVFFGAAAAWYRRFLRLANPNRGRPAARQGQRRKR